LWILGINRLFAEIGLDQRGRGEGSKNFRQKVKVTEGWQGRTCLLGCNTARYKATRASTFVRA
jgi:hypothetical protein